MQTSPDDTIAETLLMLSFVANLAPANGLSGVDADVEPPDAPWMANCRPGRRFDLSFNRGDEATDS